VVFVQGDPPEADVFLYRFEDRKSTPFLAGIADAMWPEFSPDGRWLAYGSNESGRFEVYVMSFAGRQRTLTVSHHGGKAHHPPHARPNCFAEPERLAPTRH
jgi:Tol biopolymer transport system component